MSLYSQSEFQQLHPVYWQDDQQLEEELLYNDAEYIPSEDDELAYAKWAELQEQAESIAFSRWLDTAPGILWIDQQSERYLLEFGSGSAAAGCGYS